MTSELNRIITTKDGSNSIFVPDLDEHYHSTHGAIQESEHVFIKAGLEYGVLVGNATRLNILEVGFGTGLNAYLTYLKGKQLEIELKYNAVEAFPLESNIINQLNYSQYLNEAENTIFQLMHSCNWNDEEKISTSFTLEKFLGKVQEIEITAGQDIIYYDAFGPRAQPEMWTVEIFSDLFKCLVPGGFLVTYCAKGSVKRMLKVAGFEVESLEGPPGKREMTRALKS